MALASLFFGTLVAYMLYPLVAAQLTDAAGLPLLSACVVAAGSLLTLVTTSAWLVFGRVVKKATSHAQELRERDEPLGDETFWDQTANYLAEDEEEDATPETPARVLGAVFGVLIGVWCLSAIGLAGHLLDPPFPSPTTEAPAGHVATTYREHVLPRLVKAPHVALGMRLALLARVAQELHSAGPAAVQAAENSPEIAGLFRQPGLAAALDDESLRRLVGTGDLDAALRHPRLVWILRNGDARAELLALDLNPALAAAERIVGGERLAARAEPTSDPTQPPEPEPTPDPPEPTPEPTIAEPAPDLAEPAPKPETRPEPKPPNPQIIPSVEPTAPPAHGAREHACDEGCPAFVPPHGHPRHACTESCSAFVPPHGHSRHTCDDVCPVFVPPHGHSRHTCDDVCPVFVPPHGHSRHTCDDVCPVFVPPHGHSRHACDDVCPAFVPPHGHSRHACDDVCPAFVPPHGHPRHACDDVCPAFVPPHGHPRHACDDVCPAFVPPHGHPGHSCDKGCSAFVPPRPAPKPSKGPVPKPPAPKPSKTEELPVLPPKPEPPRLPETPATVLALYAASNRYAIVPLPAIRIGQPFAFRARIEFNQARPHKDVTWRLLNAKGEEVPAFTRTVRSQALTEPRTAFVEGIVPTALLPGTYTLEVRVACPDHSPVIKTTPLELRKAPLLVQSVALSPSNGPNATAVGSSSPGVRLYLHAIYSAAAAVGASSRRLSWRATDARGRVVPELTGSERVKGKGAGRFLKVVRMDLPERLSAGAYRFEFSVDSGGERALAQVTIDVRAQ